MFSLLILLKTTIYSKTNSSSSFFRSVTDNWDPYRSWSVTFGFSESRTRTTEMTELANSAADPVSDNEDDPGKLLNAWLGELDSLKKVSEANAFGFIKV